MGLFTRCPTLRRRLITALHRHYPDVQVPQASFCTFGSWVGSDRDGNPSVTPEITWRTACYQRQLMLELYISSVQSLRQQLSISMQWSQVAPSLLESLEMDRLRFPEIYERRAARYRLEPYRLKLCYVLEKLERTLARNNQLSEAGWKMPCEALADPQAGLSGAEVLHYTSVDQFRSDLELVRNSLVSTELSCEQLDTLLHQVHIFGSHWPASTSVRRAPATAMPSTSSPAALNFPRPMGTWRDGADGMAPAGTADPSPPDPPAASWSARRPRRWRCSECCSASRRSSVRGSATPT